MASHVAAYWRVRNHFCQPSSHDFHDDMKALDCSVQNSER
jgi:hypothetical protein